MVLCKEFVDYLPIAIGVSQDEYDFCDLISVGVFGYSLKPDREDDVDGWFTSGTDVPAVSVTSSAPLRKNGVVGVVPADGASADVRLTDRSWKPICAYGYMGLMICGLCVRFPPFDGRKLFCPFSEMK